MIKKILSRKKGEWIVITSDREIIAHAWHCGSLPVPSSEFLSLIERTDISPTGEYELIEEEYADLHPGKGNPRKPSAKEKALARARKKL